MHLALYRKYRPKIFEEIISQDHITKTLKNQVKNDKTSHAYIFFGPRGTGKTSTAKIFSRAVNCLNNKDGNPCNECTNCLNILNEKTLDVIEIDAASNTSVNDVRQIRDEVKYPPSTCKKKVYIIDEVHMLSTGAFNALLKTLEEPPEHVIFILATTDIQKIPATILSRCQRFDFKRISTNDIFDRIKKIAKIENINIEDEALKLIAQKAEGGMRDALTILERFLILEQDVITYRFVSELLGASSKDIIINFINELTSNNAAKCLEIIDKIYYDGYDLNIFVEDVMNFLRNILVIRLGANIDNLDILGEEKKLMQDLANMMDSQYLTYLIKAFNDLSNTIRWTRNPRINIEIAIIRLCESYLDMSLEGLQERIRRIEKRLSNENVMLKPSTVNSEPKIEVGQRTDLIERKDSNFSSGNVIEVYERWEEIKEAIKEEKPVVYEALQEGTIKLKDGIIIQYKDTFSFYAMIVDQNLSYILDIIEKIVGKRCPVKTNVFTENDMESKEKGDDLVEKLKKLFPNTNIEVKE